jgi:hypothetical protein
VTRRFTRAVVVAVYVIAGTAAAGCSVARFIAGAPPPGEAGQAPAPLRSSGNRPGSALLVRRCSGCHEVPQPAVMTAQEWQAGLVFMKRRMNLPEWEWDSLAAMKPDTARAPAGR